MVCLKIDMYVMEYVNVDCYKFDVFVEWEDGLIECCQIVGFQDIYFGKVFSWCIDYMFNEVVVMLVFGEMVEIWGIFEYCIFDNGCEFVVKWFSGGVKICYCGKVCDDDLMGVLLFFGVEIYWVLSGYG